MGEDFNLSAVESEIKFRNIGIANGRWIVVVIQFTMTLAENSS